MKSIRVSSRFAARLSVALFPCVLALSFAGCVRGPQPTAKFEDVMVREQENDSRQDIRQINEMLLATMVNSPPPTDYILGEGDLIQVTVFEDDNLKSEGRVGARGSVTLPLLGPVPVQGLTSYEAERKIEDLYRAKYLQDPHVSIFVKEHVSGKITLMGSLKKPGTYDYFARQRLLDVLALAEGLTDKAGRTVQVRRKGDDPSHPKTLFVDLDEIIKNGKTELNIEIQGGDVIYVPEAGTVYVDGAVKRPGSYAITQTMSVQEAIASAGGLSKIADDNNVKLVRLSSNGTREVMQLNMRDSGDSSGRNIELKDRDVIYVETHGLKAMTYGLRVSVGFIGFGFDPPSTNQ